jgi:hypothetical protein
LALNQVRLVKFDIAPPPPNLNSAQAGETIVAGKEEASDTVESPQIGHPQNGKVLKVTGNCGNGRVVIQIEAVCYRTSPQSDEFVLDPEDAPSEDCQLHSPSSSEDSSP